MEDKNWIYMMEKMQDIRYFSTLMIHRTTKEDHIPAQHLDLLSRLAINKESMTPMCISKAMGVNKAIVSRIIDKLIESGYVTKKRDKQDKRSYLVSITPLGIEEVKSIYKSYLGQMYTLRKKLGDEEFFNLMNYIEKVNKIMSESGEEIGK